MSHCRRHLRFSGSYELRATSADRPRDRRDLTDRSRGCAEAQDDRNPVLRHASFFADIRVLGTSLTYRVSKQ